MVGLRLLRSFVMFSANSVSSSSHYNVCMYYNASEYITEYETDNS